MRQLSYAVVALLATAFALSASAQERVATDKAQTTQAASEQASPGQTAMHNAAASDKYLFILFWKDQTTQTDKTWKSLQSSATKLADKADFIPIQTTDPAEKAIVAKFNVSKSPMPLILAIAPCGAVTKAFPENLDEKQLASAFVSPCEALCMKAIQSNKMVFVCVAFEVPANGKTTLSQGVKDFLAEEKYARVTETVTLNAADKKEAAFLQELQIDIATKKPVFVLLAPGALIGKFDANAGRDFIVAKLASAQSGCCPGGKCGPNGCGPKK